ncbi:hypothetical protein ACFFX1_23760 [Dactylosporangium sucinum]|uniref:Uncharacterized protein n=1 Tax=Dactylosporangium sucinum TaxID=1424081 RepID=A0A917WZL1_9ACTN|nr:hypothetical protein [Dactylosporangium sucinum]GGM43349.1 hypothetical protein GCM10007977_051120 [Dactylosporangium sucinum]
MSKERARRRALLEAERAERIRRAERKRQRRAAVRRLVPKVRVGRTGKLFARRSRAQRSAIAMFVLVALALVWLLIDSVAARIGLSAFIIVATPALTVLVLDRRL